MFRPLAGLVAFSLVSVACTSQRTPQPPAANAGPSQAAAESPAAEAPPAEPEERLFGETLSDAQVTPLREITTNPEEFAGKTLKTEGEIAQVCQRMGCWMEMRAEGTPAIRVPMFQHSFFLPKDVAGRRATIEGTVALRQLGQAERDHLASEGAQAVASALEITATGVVIR